MLLESQLMVRAETAQIATPAIPVRGIRADRLTSKQLKRWDSIKEIVLAEDDSGAPLYPTLRRLWDRLSDSGHIFYVELRSGNGALSGTAGQLYMEKFDPLGLQHILVIRLYPQVIDMASVSPSAARENGFIPFKDIEKTERYAEVLGHEMAHAIDVISDINVARRLDELIQQTNEILRAYPKGKKRSPIEPGLQDRLDRRDEFAGALERSAETIEEMIWCELVSNSKHRNNK
jgi:hypothetical protein